MFSSFVIKNIRKKCQKLVLLGDHNETTNLVLDHHTFMTNLSEINRESNESELSNFTINMTLEYSAVKDLQLENMSPLAWWNYVKRLAKSRSGSCDRVHNK